MSDSDDIDKLLREIDAMNSGSTPAEPPTGKTPVPVGKRADLQTAATDSRGGRATWTLISAGGAGITGLVAGTVLGFLPFVGSLQTGLGAAIGGAVIGLISGPPRWFGSK